MKKVTECRACGSKALTPVISFSGADYVLCDPTRHARACGLLQSAQSTHDRPFEASSRHPSNRDHLRAMATEALELLSGRDCAALDIGASDGALLSYYPRWVERFGVDPSEHIDEIGAWAWSAKAAFPSGELDHAFGDKTFDIITAASVLEHVAAPRAFLAGVKARLAPDGIFALETVYAPSVLSKNAVDCFEAGLTAAYSLSVLEWIIRAEGMKVVKGSLTAKEGGSIRLFITHQDNNDLDFDPWSERLARLWDEENALALRAHQPYQSFEQRAAGVAASFAGLLNKFRERGQTVHILGADENTAALLRLAGASARAVSAIVDSHAARESDRHAQSGLAIISETESRAAEPDFLIAPARFKREMLERWRDTILLGGSMIFATPQPHVVDASNYAVEYGKTIAGNDDPGGAETLRSILAAAGGLRLVADNKKIQKSA
ncbi:MAG: class I SAM-dependent methyltransferase [Pseudomonadota bacterium]